VALLIAPAMLTPAATCFARGARAGAAVSSPGAEATPAVRSEGGTALLSGDLAGLHPDYALYIGALRPIETGPAGRLYMALVRPGASDPSGSASAPFTGPGARNDIVFDRSALDERRSDAWRRLLLDHEYFHARHVAGATSLPRPASDRPEIQRHFYEAAAWGWNVGRARAGLYPGLRPAEFREALDRYGDHYRALQSLLTRDQAAPGQGGLDARRLRAPEDLLTTISTPPPADRARPADSDRSPATVSGTRAPCLAAGPASRRAPAR
jgi:hypothetical protein